LSLVALGNRPGCRWWRSAGAGGGGAPVPIVPVAAGGCGYGGRPLVVWAGSRPH